MSYIKAVKNAVLYGAENFVERSLDYSSYEYGWQDQWQLPFLFTTSMSLSTSITLYLRKENP